MSFLSLLNSKCAIQRRHNVGRNDFFEAIVEWHTIARNVPTTREHVGRDTLDHYGIPAEIGKSRHIFYFLPDTDIQLGDRILVTQLPKTFLEIKNEIDSLCESFSSSLSSSSTEVSETSSSSTLLSTSESSSTSITSSSTVGLSSSSTSSDSSSRGAGVVTRRNKRFYRNDQGQHFPILHYRGKELIVTEEGFIPLQEVVSILTP
jgi:hypothetical protein